jgi:hypothetical protein
MGKVQVGKMVCARCRTRRTLLCLSTTAGHAWAVPQRPYDDYAGIVADTDSGLLWKPTERLIQRARKLRATGTVTYTILHLRQMPSSPTSVGITSYSQAMALRTQVHEQLA